MMSYQGVDCKYQSGSSSPRALLSFDFSGHLSGVAKRPDALDSWMPCFVCMTTSTSSLTSTVITMESLLCNTLPPFMRLHLQHSDLQRQIIDDQLDGRPQTCRKVQNVDKVVVFSGVFLLLENVPGIDVHRLTDVFPVFFVQPGQAPHQFFKRVEGHGNPHCNVFVSQSLEVDFFTECVDGGINIFFISFDLLGKENLVTHFCVKHVKRCCPVHSVWFVDIDKLIWFEK
ncbi:hypothetical protein ACWKX9_25340 [Enterobacter asburiae]